MLTSKPTLARLLSALALLALLTGLTVAPSPAYAASATGSLATTSTSVTKTGCFSHPFSLTMTLSGVKSWSGYVIATGLKDTNRRYVYASSSVDGTTTVTNDVSVCPVSGTQTVTLTAEITVKDAAGATTTASISPTSFTVTTPPAPRGTATVASPSREIDPTKCWDQPFTLTTNLSASTVSWNSDIYLTDGAGRRSSDYLYTSTTPLASSTPGSWSICPWSVNTGTLTITGVVTAKNAFGETTTIPITPATVVLSKARTGVVMQVSKKKGRYQIVMVASAGTWAKPYGLEMMLQKRVGKKWRNIRASRDETDERGRVTYVYKPKGKTVLRAALRGDSKYESAVSASRTVR